jgi:hypothetical protein
MNTDDLDSDVGLVFFLVGFFVWILIFGLVGALIGRYRGRIGSGVFWGVLFGPLGWLITALLKDLRPKCPHCAAAFNAAASHCCHCGGEIRTTAPTVSSVTPSLSSSNVRYYYSTDGEQQGPVDTSDLRMMRKDGLITDDTAVIREGESQWRQFRDYLALTR